MIKCRKCQSDKTSPIGPDYTNFKIYRCRKCSHDSVIWNKKQTLNSFCPEFWHVQDACVRYSGQPISVEQALWGISTKNWDKMVRSLFSGSYQPPSTVGVEQVMDIIRETNTCSGLDFPVEVWVDKKGDFKIKVYE